MTRVFAVFDHGLRLAISLSMFGIMLAIGFQVIARGTVGAFPWPEELSVILMIWGLMLAGAYVLNEHGHIGISFFVDRLSLRKAASVNVIVHLLIVLFCVAVIYGSIDKIASVSRLKTGALGISRAIPNLAIPVSCGLYALVSLRIAAESALAWRRAV